MNFIEGVELNIYSINGQDFSINLSPKQLLIVIKILGLDLTYDGNLKCFSDETLDEFITMKGNPLKLKLIN